MKADVTNLYFMDQDDEPTLQVTPTCVWVNLALDKTNGRLPAMHFKNLAAARQWTEKLLAQLQDADPDYIVISDADFAELVGETEDGARIMTSGEQV